MSDGMSLQPELKNPFVVRMKKKMITAKQNNMNKENETISRNSKEPGISESHVITTDRIAITEMIIVAMNELILLADLRDPIILSGSSLTRALLAGFESR